MTAETLPAINACLNALATLLLVNGYVAIRRNRPRTHATLMILAFVVSSVFLVLYLLHKYWYPNRSLGIEPGVWRTLYFAVLLAPHVILAMVMLPFILATFYLAARRRWGAHRRVARPTFWVWLYVSVTGVIIYLLLYHVFPTGPGGA